MILIDSGFRRDSDVEIQQIPEIVNKKGYTRHYDSSDEIEDSIIETNTKPIKFSQELEMIESDVINPLSPEGITNSHLDTKNHTNANQTKLHSFRLYSIRLYL